MKNIKNIETDYSLVLTKKDLSEMIKILSEKEVISYDSETTGIDLFKDHIIGVSFSYDIGKGFFIPIPFKFEKSNFKRFWGKEEILKKYDMDFDFVFNRLKIILENENIKKVGQNLIFDIRFLKEKTSIEMKNIYFDTMIFSLLKYSNLTKHTLSFLSLEFLEYEMINYSDIVKENETLLDLPINDVMNYAVEDTDIVLKLYNYFSRIELSEQEKEDFYAIEMPLMRLIAKLESVRPSLKGNEHRRIFYNQRFFMKNFLKMEIVDKMDTFYNEGKFLYQDKIKVKEYRDIKELKKDVLNMDFNKVIGFSKKNIYYMG